MNEVKQIQEVYAAYQSGIESTTIAGRELNFNKTLFLLQELQLETGAYYYDVGNTYYQLEQYPWALFYYIKAQKELPRDPEVKKNIQATVEKLQLKSDVPSLWLPLSEKEGFAILQLLILLAVVILSLRIWLKGKSLKIFSRGAVIAVIFGFLFVVSRYYFTLEQGVLAKAAILYKKPGTQYERVLLDPLPPGTVLEIIGEAAGGSFAKIVNKEGSIGYVQTDHLLL